jgi:hypothetical protein
MILALSTFEHAESNKQEKDVKNGTIKRKINTIVLQHAGVENEWAVNKIYAEQITELATKATKKRYDARRNDAARQSCGIGE